MKLQSFLVAGLVLGVTLPHAAVAQTDFMTAKKLSCLPDRLTRCSADNKCESKDATARDKTQPLILDAENKTAVVRRGSEERPFGTIVDDKVEGDVRKMTLREPGDDDSKQPGFTLTITREGKLTMASADNRMRAEATCSPAT
jgi:hypothetical protein